MEGGLAESEELARIWLPAAKEGELSDVDTIRLDNLWIDWVNSQRSNFVRANVVGEDGLARQAILAVVFLPAFERPPAITCQQKP